MNRVQDLKNHIASKYPKLAVKKFDIAKIGARIYIYFVDIEGNLQREQLFRGALPMVNEVPVLRQQLDLNIKNVMQKWYFC
jgi:hypothetical protein